MAERKNKRKDNTNVEKMKREMATKMQRAIPSKKAPNSISSDAEFINETAEIKKAISKKRNRKKEDIEKKSSDLISVDAAVLEISNDNEEAQEHESEDLSKSKMIVFRMGKEEFALKVDVIREITQIPNLIHVPNAPYYIAGLCSLRGEVLPIIDSKKLFHLNEVEYVENSRVIITEIGQKKVGLLVDKVSEILSVDKSDIKDAPSNLRGDDSNVSGMLFLSGSKRIILIIDPHKLSVLGYDYTEQAYKEGGELGNVDEGLQVVAFHVGEEEYAFDVELVKEVIRYPKLFKIPQTSDYIDGVISLRDRLVAIINLDKLLGMHLRDTNSERRVIIVDNGSSTFGIVVDRISNIMRIAKSSIKESKLNILSHKGSYIKSFIDLDQGKRMIMLLHLDNMIMQKDMDLIYESQQGEALSEQSQIVIDSKNEHVVIFKLNQDEFAMQIQYVKEIYNMDELVNFPGAPPFIEGLTCLREETIPVMNLKSLLLEDSHELTSTKILVIEYNQKKIGLLIDSASDVMKISQNDIHSVAEDMIQGNEANYVDAVAKLNDGKRIVLLLNLPGLLKFS